MTSLEMLKKLSGESDEKLLSLLLEIAENKMLNYMNRRILPAKLEITKVNWALIAYNRMGMEGESSRAEGGISQAFIEIPADIKIQLNANRLAKVGGKTYEAVETEKSY